MYEAGYEGKRGREAEFMNAGDLVLLHLPNRRRMDMRRGNLRDTSDRKERDASSVALCRAIAGRRVIFRQLVIRQLDYPWSPS